MIDFFLSHGILVLGLCFLVDDLGVPFPSGTTLFAAAVIAANKDVFSPLALFFAAVGYSTLGNLILYVWGRHGAKKWLHTHGHKFFLPQKRLEKFEDFFERKHGRKTIFLTSMVNNIRPFMALLAGSSGMSPIKFFPVNIAGICIWAGTLTSIGYFYGEQIWVFLRMYWELILYLLVILVLVKYIFWRLFFSKKK